MECINVCLQLHRVCGVLDSGVGVMRRVKGWGLGRGLPSPVGGLGLATRKKNNFALKIMQFRLLQHKNFQHAKIEKKTTFIMKSLT